MDTLLKVPRAPKVVLSAEPIGSSAAVWSPKGRMRFHYVAVARPVRIPLSDLEGTGVRAGQGENGTGANLAIGLTGRTGRRDATGSQRRRARWHLLGRTVGECPRTTARTGR